MTKQEQIKEMYKIIADKYGRYGCHYVVNLEKCAEALYDAGYRKGNKEKNCWECIESKRVTSDDYAKLQELFADYQLASEKEIRAHEERTKAFERNMKSVLEIEKENVRKETAKEILQYLYEKMGNVALSDTELVTAVASLYGVEVKE